MRHVLVIICISRRARSSSVVRARIVVSRRSSVARPRAVFVLGSASRAASRRLPRLVAFARVPLAPDARASNASSRVFSNSSHRLARAPASAKPYERYGGNPFPTLLPLLQLLQQLKRPRDDDVSPLAPNISLLAFVRARAFALAFASRAPKCVDDDVFKTSTILLTARNESLARFLLARSLPPPDVAARVLHPLRVVSLDARERALLVRRPDAHAHAERERGDARARSAHERRRRERSRERAVTRATKTDVHRALHRDVVRRRRGVGRHGPRSRRSRCRVVRAARARHGVRRVDARERGRERRRQCDWTVTDAEVGVEDAARAVVGRAAGARARATGRTARAREDVARAVKLVLLGASAAGKTALSARYVRDDFLPEGKATVGAAFASHAVRLEPEDVTCKFEIWDTAGQERYQSLAPLYYRGATAALIVFDVTSEKASSARGIGPRS